ncbi:hypothetical protein EON66_09405, partial [archaeon]
MWPRQQLTHAQRVHGGAPQRQSAHCQTAHVRINVGGWLPPPRGGRTVRTLPLLLCLACCFATSHAARIITTVVGGIGDGGSAAAAKVTSPSGLSAYYNASSGGVVLYIADSGNYRIRRVDEGGVITTVAGNGIQGFSGDGGAAVDAMLSGPSDVAALYNASSGGVVVYAADSSNNRIRRVDAAGVISTVAGTGVFGHSG